MFQNLSEEIAEEFDSFDNSIRDSHRSPWDFSPRLNEEVDLQEWHNHILLSRPCLSDNDGSPQTCIRVTVMKWKNSHGEGKWFSASTSNSWGEQDYADMVAAKSCVDVWSLLNPEKPVHEIEAEDEAKPETVTVIAPKETKRVRIQVTMREGGEYVAGRNGNFQLQGASGEAVIEMLRPLEVRWPRCVKSQSSVRVQIQNLIGGKMSGGGNYQLHNADVPEVLSAIEGLVGCLVVEKRSGVPSVLEPVMPETPKATEAVVKTPEAIEVKTPSSAKHMAETLKSWKDTSKECPNCGCGKVGSCLCVALAAR